MPTLGYKLGMFKGMELVNDIICLDRCFDGSESEYVYINGAGYLKDGSAVKKTRWKDRIYYALITLEIPDNAARSTPDIRDSILKHAGLSITEREIFSPLKMRTAFEGAISELTIATFDGVFYYTPMKNIFKNSPFKPMSLNKFKSVISDSKCRCSMAKVIKVELLEPDGYITDAYTSYSSSNLGRPKTCHYKLGEMVYPDEWDPDLMEQCSHGIHYFEDPRYALAYGLWFYPGFINGVFENCDYVMNRYF